MCRRARKRQSVRGRRIFSMFDRRRRVRNREIRLCIPLVPHLSLVRESPYRHLQLRVAGQIKWLLRQIWVRLVRQNLLEVEIERSAPGRERRVETNSTCSWKPVLCCSDGCSALHHHTESARNNPTVHASPPRVGYGRTASQSERCGCS